MENVVRRKTVAFTTLGCKMNQADTAAVAARFEAAGYSVVPFTAQADVYVINTCTVTGETGHQCRQILRRAMREKEARPGVRIVATGCYAQVDPDGLQKLVPGLDLIAGTLEKESIAALLEQGAAGALVGDVSAAAAFTPEQPASASGRTRGFLRIQDGCDCRCSYCIVPFARGPSRSATPETVLENARALAAAGHLEIVVTGIHIGMYGADLPEKPSLASLLAQIHQIPAVRRIRLSSLEPREFTPQLLAAIASLPKICPHFHISLQSGDPAILRLMRRSYTPGAFAAAAAALRNIHPLAAIGADIITGFPGEDEAAHRNTLDFVRQMNLAYMHVFRYSERPGTAAAGFPGKIHPDEKNRRARELNSLRSTLVANYNSAFTGRTLDVLFEEQTPGRPGEMTGLTPNYLRVTTRATESVRGTIVPIEINGYDGKYLLGTTQQS